MMKKKQRAVNHAESAFPHESKSSKSIPSKTKESLKYNSLAYILKELSMIQ